MLENKLRIAGNICLIVGYFIMLNINLPIGVCIKLMGSLLFTPFVIKHKAYDMILVVGIFSSIDAHSLIKHLAG